MANQALLKSEAPEEGGLVNQNAAAVLIADDDPAIRLILRHRLEAAGYNVSEAADSNAALAALRTNGFDAALLDIIMPGPGGLEVLSAAQAEGIKTAIIVITAASTMSNAVEAIKRGAHDYLTKPFHNLDLVAAAVERAVELTAQAAEINRLKTEVGHQLVGGEIVGRSPAMQEVYKLIGRLVNNDANVLICGESGTGKELVARAIHFKSERWRAPFVAVNCSAIPQGLLESELFGHERANSSWPDAARCSWTRSATCRWNSSPSCCARSRSASSARSAVPKCGACKPASSPRPTRISRRRWRRAASAKTSISACG
jgi:DNA-binding NtrC family response regulator